MTKNLCKACAAGPSKIEGHSNLWAQTIGTGLFSFKCRECDTVWKRTSVGAEYAWENITEQIARHPAGVKLPTKKQP
jgi:hypothetical protein